MTDPIYKQVSDMLLELVRTDYRPGMQFLTERQISERFGISRTTANKALANLVVDGVVVFRKGVGTFVAAPKPNLDLKRLVSFTERARAAGLVPGTRCRSFRETTLSAVKRIPRREVLATLTAPGTTDDDAGRGTSGPAALDTSVYEIERVRSVDDDPVVYERRVLLAGPCPGLTRADVEGSLYTVFAERYDLELAGVAQRIRARAARAAEARVLVTHDGAAVLEVSGVGYLAGGVPLWHELTLYRGDAYEFLNQVTASGDTSQATVAHTVAITPEDVRRHWYDWGKTT